MTQPKHPIHQPGQSFNEYILVGGLVVIVSLISLTALGNNVNGMFTNMIGQNTNQPALANPTSGGAGGTRTGNNPTSGGTGNNGLSLSLTDQGFSQTEVRLPNGQTFRSSIPDGALLMETLGPNGTTNAYLTQLDAWVTALKRSLPADDPLQQMLSDLANTGHTVAQDQRMSISYVGDIADKKSTAGVANKALLCLNQTCSDFLNQGLTKGQLSTVESYMSANSMSILSDKAETLTTLLKGRGMDDSAQLMNFLTGNIVRTAAETGKVIFPLEWSALGETGPGSPNAKISDNQFANSDAVKTALQNIAFIEYNANGICGMSSQTNCLRQNGIGIGNGNSNSNSSSTLGATNQIVNTVQLGTGSNSSVNTQFGSMNVSSPVSGGTGGGVMRTQNNLNVKNSGWGNSNAGSNNTLNQNSASPDVSGTAGGLGIRNNGGSNSNLGATNQIVNTVQLGTGSNSANNTQFGSMNAPSPVPGGPGNVRPR